MIELEDFLGNKFTEGDYVVFADNAMSLRIAKVRGIKANAYNGHQIALEVVDGLGVRKKRYSRGYHQYDFMKTDYTTKGDSDD